jgi:hypothetical protein
MAEPKEEIVKSSLPGVMTVRIWDTYAAGRRAYITRTTPRAPSLIADYAGALAVIKAQFVRVMGQRNLSVT